MKGNLLIILLLTGLIFTNSTLSLGQSKKKEVKAIEKKANAYFIDEIFRLALPLYLQLDELEPDKIETNHRIGICLLHS